LPDVSDGTEIGLSLRRPVRVTPRLLDAHVAVYVVIGLPPLLTGAENPTDPVVPVIENVPMPGLPGTDTGTIVFDAADGGPEPIALRGVTVHL
jgi:hypothetical protein